MNLEAWPMWTKIIRSIRYGLRDPEAVMIYLAQSRTGLNHLFTKRLLDLPKEDYLRYLEDLARSTSFLRHVEQKLRSVGPTRGEFHVGGPGLLYIITRALKPRTVVETGVAAGISSAFILMALEANGSGDLYSIDMPGYDTELSRRGVISKSVAELPVNNPGFVIPSDLMRRWHLRIGLSRNELSPLLGELGRIDVFLHDSEHSYENMLFEYRASWPYLSAGGVLLSHDILWNRAFFDFSKAVKRKPHLCYFTSIGGIRK
jgi:predicted O-methyltransferase YrrM